MNFVVSLLFLGSSVACFCAESLSIEELSVKARESFVVIEQSGRDGELEGVGGGFVISADGLVATSLHVIGEARPVTVTFSDGSKSEVTTVHAWDRKLDLAVLRLAKTGLKPLRLGDSDNLKQGTRVMAMGNPRGFKFSVVEGVVSAIRSFDWGPMIQLAMPVEPGNSGGPVLDMKGNVVGIISMKSAVTENLGFALPVNSLKPLLEKPNPVPMSRWLTLGALPASQWQPVMGANWRRRGAEIHVEGIGSGFGGRSLCIYQKEPPELPYELAVTVKLDDESGAAGLIFGSDEADKHFGFYPTAGKLRLTRFDGPDVFSWNILQETASEVYRSGDWNDIRVRVEPDKVICFLNGQKIFEEAVKVRGKAGLAKFRQTKAQFKNFYLGKEAPQPTSTIAEVSAELKKEIENLEKDSWNSSLRKTGDFSPDLLENAAAARGVLLARAKEMDKQAEGLRKSAADLQVAEVEQKLKEEFKKPEEQIDLFRAALLVATLNNPDLDVNAYTRELNEMAEELNSKIGKEAGAAEKLKALNTYLFDENGFHGSRSDYYNAANSFMNSVLDDREGIPLTLSILHLELGRRAGIEGLSGIPFPGHFMVEFKHGDDREYLDVFDAAKSYGTNEVRTFIVERSNVPLDEKHFRPATKRDMITRMLHNLIGLATAKQDAPHGIAYINVLLTLSPDEHPERFRRAWFYLQSGERSKARGDLEYLLAHKPAGLDQERLEELLHSL
jgi:serine protease Do